MRATQIFFVMMITGIIALIIQIHKKITVLLPVKNRTVISVI